jgi:hypothetical protein
LVTLLVVALAIPAIAATSAGATFTLQILPGERSDEEIAWYDVNGDGRRDFIRQADRWLEVYLLDDRRHLQSKPAWRVEIAPPWDLWDFADVRPDLPGEELLALSPQGVGWLSYQRHSTSTAQMEILVTASLPVAADRQRAYRGQYVVRLVKNRPPDLLLPSRSSMRIFRRQPDSGQWAVAEEIPEPLRPWPTFEARSAEPYLVGFNRMPGISQRPPLSPAVPGRLAWRQFRFWTYWIGSAGWLTDWNGDGRLDWASSSVGSPQGKLQVFLQTPEGKFDRERPIVPSWPDPANRPEEKTRKRRPGKSPSDSGSGASWLPELSELRFEHLADVNGDGRLDIVRIASEENWAAPKTHVTVYLQNAENGFPREPDSSLRVGAVLPTEVLPMADLDGDGDLDLLLLRLDLQIASVQSHMKAFLRQGLETYLGAYRWNKGSYSKRPVWEKRVVIGHDLFEFSRDPQPLMQFDRDVTGDGRPDLILRLKRDTVGVFALSSPEKGFAETAIATLKVPFNIEKIECDDYDGDGLNDIRVEGWDPQDRNRVPRAVFFNNASNP